MKNETIAAIAVIVLIVLGVQTYMVFQLNDRLNQFSEQSSQTDSFEIKIPKLSKLNPQLNPLKPDVDSDNGWNPYDEMHRLQNEMEKMFGDSFSRFHRNTPLGNLSKTPDIDVEEKPDVYIVTVNAPGADRSSLDVTLKGERLHISIKTEQAKDDSDDKNGHYQYRERFVGEFERFIKLPGPADATKMTSDYRDGVLKITIPKAA